MKNDNEIKNEWGDLRKKSFKEIEMVLRKYDYDAQTMVASFCASICNVDVADMLSPSDNLYVKQTRWLYMFAIRYMTHETYDAIAKRMMIDGCTITKDGVRKGIERMAELIDNDDTWLGRWVVIKRMIKLKNNPHDYPLSDFTDPMPEKYKVTISVPKGMGKNIEVDVKENKQ